MTGTNSIEAVFRPLAQMGQTSEGSIMCTSTAHVQTFVLSSCTKVNPTISLDSFSMVNSLIK